MRASRLTTFIGGAALLAAVPAVAQAQTAEPAPPGEASAVAARVGETVSIAETDARATTDASSSGATANVVEIGGAPPLAQLGATQTGPGTSAGALVDTGDSQTLRIAIAPHSAQVTDSGATRTAASQAALARLILGPNVLGVHLLQSSSEASHTGQVSRGSTSSDTAVIDVAGLRVVLLHADATSDGQGQTYLLGLDDTKIGTNEQLGNATTLNVPGVLTLNALEVSGGAGSVTAAVTDALPLNTEALRTQIQNVTASGGSASAQLPAARELGGGFGAGGGTGGGLAATGRSLSLAALAGLGLVALGAAAVAGTRRAALSAA